MATKPRPMKKLDAKLAIGQTVAEKRMQDQALELAASGVATYVPEGAKCQEASSLSQARYIPCLAPAKLLIDNGDSHLYYMCYEHASHNVRNRGAKVVLIPSSKPIFSMDDVMAVTTKGMFPAAREIVREMVKDVTPAQAPPPAMTPPAYPEFEKHEVKFSDLQSFAPEAANLLHFLVDERRKAAAEASLQEQRRKDLDDQIKGLFGDIGFNYVVVPGGWVAEEFQGRSPSRLNDKKLIEAGVSPDLIASCREPGKLYRYVKVHQLDEDA